MSAYERIETCGGLDTQSNRQDLRHGRRGGMNTPAVSYTPPDFRRLLSPTRSGFISGFR